MIDIAALAERQLHDYDEHRPGRCFKDPSVSLSIEQAYELQDAVASLREQRGEAVVGYKLGTVSAAIQAQLGLDEPVFGRLFAGELHPTGSRLDTRAFESPAVEGEVAFRIGRDIADAGWLSRNVAAAIASVFAVVELHDFVFRRRPPTGPELIANNALHAGLVLPAAETLDLEPGVLGSLRLAVARNGVELGATTGAEPHDGPLGSLLTLVDRLAARGLHLRRGQIVLTGSQLPLYPVGAGDEIRVECEPLQPVEVSFA